VARIGVSYTLIKRGFCRGGKQPATLEFDGDNRFAAARAAIVKAIPDVPPATITSFIKMAFAEHGGADAIYILGSSLEALPLIASLESELGVPVVQAIAPRIWEIRKRLHVHEPIKGVGLLLETLPT